MSETKTVTATPEQLTAIKLIAEMCSGNIDIESVAGSGKTWTLLAGLRELIGGRTAFMAFSRDIFKEVDAKVELIRPKLRTNVDVGTVHRFGRRIIANVWPKIQIMKKTEKAQLLMPQIVYPRDPSLKGVPKELQSFVTKAYILSRQWGVGVNPEFPFGSRDAWYKLIDHFDLEELLINDEDNIPYNLDELVQQAVNWTVALLKKGIDTADKFIDFEDMIYIPLIKNLPLTRWHKYDVILVDERQDLNWTRTALVRKMLADKGKAVFVGDVHQAIFGFTGADAKSTENIQKSFQTRNIQLSVSHRCAQSIVRFVQQWVNHIHAAPTAPQGLSPLDPGGVIQTHELWQQNLSIEPKQDAILCRNNAPLVELWFECLKRGIPAHIEGRDISERLIRVLNKFPKVKAWDTLRKRLEQYKEKEVKRLNTKGHEDKAGDIADVVDALIAIMDSMPPTSRVSDIKTKITAMFKDDEETGTKAKTLTLTTIHKSKGREWQRVFWYGRNRWNPSSYAKQDWQMEQEVNLMYVAGTRAINTLIDVVVPAPTPRR